MTIEKFRGFYQILDVLKVFFVKVMEFFQTPFSEAIDLGLDDLPEWVQTLLNPSIWIADKIGFGDDTVLEVMLSAGIILALVWGLLKFFLPT